MLECDVGDRFVMLETWNSTWCHIQYHFSICKQIPRDLHRSPTSLYCVLLIIMWTFWARLIRALPAQGHLEVTLSVFPNSDGSWWFFEQEIYTKSNGRLSKITYVWNNYSLMPTSPAGLIYWQFPSFFRFNRCYLWFFKLFWLINFSEDTSWSLAFI